MSTFSYIETFFFITLGITFGLIVLLVYHFKKSINTIEQKCDTMFDIVQNITKDLFAVKSNVVGLSSQIQKLESQQQQQQQPISRQPFFPFMQSMSSPPFQNTNNDEKTITIQRNEFVVEELPEEEEESDEESEDSESDEDDNESDNDNDEDDDESKCSTKHEKIVVIDYELNTNTYAENMNSISEGNNDIKIINIQDESEVFLSEYRNDFINQIFRTSELIDSNTYPHSLHDESTSTTSFSNSELIDSNTYPHSLHAESTSTTSISNIVTEVVNEILEKSISNSEPVSINTETLTINNIESELPPVLSLDSLSQSQSISHQIVVNKLNKIADIEFFDDSQSVTSVSKTEKGEKNEKNEAKDIYKKMSIQELKQLVISKGLCSDASKFKKNELIRLLHNQT